MYPVLSEVGIGKRISAFSSLTASICCFTPLAFTLIEFSGAGQLSNIFSGKKPSAPLEQSHLASRNFDEDDFGESESYRR